jgi:peptidoglycan/LPS O-acetylase OafA/YrhL
VDAVRGVCVLAVVFGHFVGWGLEPVSGTGAETFWEKSSGQLTPIRMPTLFVLSGFLLSSRVRAGFTDRRAFMAAATSYYLYVVWLAVFGLIAAVGVHSGVDGISGFASQLLLPRTVLWFVLGLATWTIVLAALRRVHPMVILIPLGMLSIASFWLPGENGVDHYVRVLQYGFFFGLGVYGKPILRKLVSGNLRRVSAVALAGYVVTRVIMSAGSDVDVVEATLTIVRDTAAAVVAIVAIAAICHLRWARVPLVWVGCRTLPIYVMHGPMIAALTDLTGWGFVVGTRGVAWAAPLVGTVVISAVAVGAHAVLSRTPLRILFELPIGMKRRLNGRAVTPSSDVERAEHH